MATTVLYNVDAHEVEEHDLVGFQIDSAYEELEVTKKIDDGSTIYLKGESRLTGDTETYPFDPYQTLDVLGA